MNTGEAHIQYQIMRKKFIYLLLVALCFPIITEAQTKVDKGLIARYLFNGNAKDASTNGNDGTRIGGVTDIKDRFGNECAAFDFNGVDGYVEVPHSKSLSTPRDEIGVTAWLKLKEGTPFSELQWMTLICKSDDPQETDNSPQYRIQSTKVTLSINTDFTEETKHLLEFDEWFFYSVTYDGQTVRAFVNGTMFAEFDYMTEFELNTLPLNIGRDMPGNLEFYGGAMDDLRIYNRSLSENEIQQLLKDNSEKTSPKPCDKKSACNILDIKANPLDCYIDKGEHLHDVELIITYENPPKNGNLYVEAGGVRKTARINPKGKTEMLLLGIPSDRNDVFVKAYFSKDKACEYTVPDLYVAPNPCEEKKDCDIFNISVNEGACYQDSGFSVFDLSVDIQHSNIPTGEKLVIKAGGLKKTIEAGKNSSSITIKGLPVNGSTATVICYLSSNSSCKLIKKDIINSPKPCKGTNPTPSNKDCIINSTNVVDLGDCYLDGNESYYNLKLNVDYENPPSNCELLVYIGGEERTLNCQSNNGGEIFTIKKLRADAAEKDIVVVFTDESDCAVISSATFTSPAPCPPPVSKKCAISSIDPEVSDCRTDNGKSLYDVRLTVNYTNPPSSGKLIVKMKGQQKEIDFNPAKSRALAIFRNIEADGKPVMVSAFFKSDKKCLKIAPNLFTAPEPCVDEEVGKIDFQKKITVKNSDVKIYFYDHMREDGDIVSVKFDGKWVVNKLELRKEEFAESIDVSLEEGKTYELISKAWNLGEVEPNTLTVKIVDIKTNRSQVIKLNSRIGISGSMKIVYER
ncbi:MAG: hypothetical protein ACI94Y_003092 [Maribacter sp.]|jgi:hypothetical protein